MRTRPLALAALLLPALVACDRPDDPGMAPIASVDTAPEFRQAHAAWVRERADALNKPDGWTRLIGLHWVEADRQRVGGGAQDDIRLAIAPPHLGELERRADGIYFTADQDAMVTVDGRPLQGEVALQPEGRDGGTQLGYDEGKGRISLIRRGDRLGLRVRHADAPARRQFAGLDFFEPDPAWRVQARFVAHPPGTTLPIANIIGDIHDTPNPGYVEFDKDGHRWRLEALGDPQQGLSLNFQDRTSGRDTYAVGRYLQTGPVADDATVVVDFNRAYNPPCAYTAYATCPLPPPGNRLAQRDANGQMVRLAVLAGEKAYAGAPH
ncbi:DUF1684 domain-containing protein [Luteimonas sp. TWI1416]|uniref:DUF1684 domain-containing protein n=1 Tax=unclassified Luteimonas TaxID=2629088 RepID=UPI00320A87FA